MNKKFFNIKTEEVKEFTIDVDIFYSPYLGTMKDQSGKIIGHSHQAAYFDKDGNEYRPYYGNLKIGTAAKIKVNYNKGPSKWGILNDKRKD